MKIRIITCLQWIHNSEVMEQVEMYFKKYLPGYTVLKVREKSYHPDNHHLYMVSGKNLIRIDNAMDKILERLQDYENLLQQQETAQDEVGKTFPYEEELK